MSKLPEFMEEETIFSMPIGEEGYTVSWAMYADSNRDLYVNGNYTVSKAPGGTVKMRIKRTKEGVIVYQHSIRNEKYSAGDPCYVGAFIPLPVTLV